MPTPPARLRTLQPAPGPASAPRVDTDAVMQLARIQTSHPLGRAVPVTGDPHPALVYLATLQSPQSRRTMRQALEAIAHALSGGTCDALTLPWAALRYPHAAALRAVLADRLAPATARKYLAALRGVMTAAWRLELLDAETLRRTLDVAPVRGTAAPAGRALLAGELRALFAVCADDPTPAGRRDAALLAVLYGGGLRRAEAVGLALGDYTPETGALLVRVGKGRRARTVFLAPSGQAAVAAWLAVRLPVSSTPTSPLFVPITRGGRLVLRWPTSQLVFTAAVKRAGEAGIAAFSPHDCRRTFVGDLLEAGADLSVVQQLAGHASVTTTARYDRRGEVAKRKAAHLLHIPFRPADCERTSERGDVRRM